MIPQKKGRSYLRKHNNCSWLMNERASNTAENAPFIPWGHRFFIFFSLWEERGRPRFLPFLRGLVYWGSMPYLGMNVPLPSGICPFCVFSIKLCPIGGKNNDSLGQSSWFDRSYKGTIMWRVKCPIKAWRCPFAHFVSSLFNCAPSEEKIRGDNFQVPSSL